jgi:predicted DNA-binding protein
MKRKSKLIRKTYYVLPEHAKRIIALANKTGETESGAMRDIIISYFAQ